jgi:hypothetical protein
MPSAYDMVPAAYVVRCACDPSLDGTGGETVVDHIRLFPLRSDVRWTYRVHEQILPALRKVDVPVRWTDVIVRHTGYVDTALRARKLDRDTRLLRVDLEDHPQDPFIPLMGADGAAPCQHRPAKQGRCFQGADRVTMKP